MVCTEIPIGAEIERHLIFGGAIRARFGDLGPDQDGLTGAQCVTNAELVEHVRVVHRDVGDHQVGEQQLLEHVDADISRLDELHRRVAGDFRRGERWIHEPPLHFGEVDAAARTEWADDEGAHRQRNGPKCSR